MIEDVGLEPGITGPTTPALINSRLPFVSASPISAAINRHVSVSWCSYLQFLARSQPGMLMRGERNVHISPGIFGDSIERFPHSIGIGGDEVGMIVEDSDLIHRHGHPPRQPPGPVAMSSRYWGGQLEKKSCTPREPRREPFSPHRRPSPPGFLSASDASFDCPSKSAMIFRGDRVPAAARR